MGGLVDSSKGVWWLFFEPICFFYKYLPVKKTTVLPFKTISVYFRPANSDWLWQAHPPAFQKNSLPPPGSGSDNLTLPKPHLIIPFFNMPLIETKLYLEYFTVFERAFKKICPIWWQSGNQLFFFRHMKEMWQGFERQISVSDNLLIQTLLIQLFYETF